MTDLMTPRAREIVWNAALTVFSLACAFAVCEIAVRLLYKDATVLFPRYHTDYRYGRYTIRGIRSNSEFWHTSVDGSWKFITNSKGFRNTKEFPYAKTTGTLRVLSLGDSQTQGYEVRQDATFSAVLERFLRHHGIEAEVINTGVSGFSTAEERVFLENEGLKYHPDVVVLGFYANDFEDNLRAGLFGLDAQNRLIEARFDYIPGVRIQNAIYSIPPVRWLSENSYFYSLLFNTVWDNLRARLSKARLAEPQAQQAGAKGESTATGLDELEYAVPTSATVTGYQLTLGAELIEDMHRVCADLGIRFIVVDIPTQPAFYHFASSFPPLLLERLKAAGIEYVSSQSVLGDFDGVAEMSRPGGHNHISEFTHALIGIAIGKRLLGSSAGAVTR